MLKKCGPSKIHRKSFTPVKKYAEIKHYGRKYKNR